MDRRDFIKKTALGAAVLGAAACKNGTASAAKNGAAPEEGSGSMELRTNPASGDKVSLLGFGCMRWPMVKDAEGKDVIDQEAVNEMVDYAYRHGVNYYDTSPVYLRGQSETATGIALSRYPRQSYYLATKLSNFGNNSWEASKKMYQESLRELRTDYFDYYLLHSIGRGGYPAFKKRYEDNGAMEFLLKEREAGRIRNLGFSFHGKQDAFDELLALHDKYHWDFVQIEMNYLDWRHAKTPDNTNAEYLYAELEKRQIPVVVMEPILGGRLASLPDGPTEKLLSRDPRSSVASWALRFAASYPGVLCVLSGMSNMEVVEENMKTFGHFDPLSDEEKNFLLEIADLLDSYPTVPCTNCKYCMPCPYGVDIPGIFAHYNAMVNGGFVALSKEQKDYQKLRRRYLISYDRSIETLRQANHCIHCRQCMEHCPQSIRIPSELSRIDRYIEKLKQNTL